MNVTGDVLILLLILQVPPPYKVKFRQMLEVNCKAYVGVTINTVVSVLIGEYAKERRHE